MVETSAETSPRPEERPIFDASPPETNLRNSRPIEGVIFRLVLARKRVRVQAEQRAKRWVELPSDLQIAAGGKMAGKKVAEVASLISKVRIS